MADKAEVKGSGKKQGLHGWRAAAAVFGCGTLAAFAVFGLIVGVLGSLLSSISSPMGDSQETARVPADRVAGSRSSLAEGQMDVCGDNLDELTTISTTRQDSGENYVDTLSGGSFTLEGAERVVADSCQWTINPEGGGTPWIFTFDYEAVIDAESNLTKEEVAAQRYEEIQSSLAGDIAQVESEGGSGLASQSYFVYGINERGQSAYVAVFLAKSAVYKITFEAQEETSVSDVSELEFRNEARKITSFLTQGFQYWIPDAE